MSCSTQHSHLNLGCQHALLMINMTTHSSLFIQHQEQPRQQIKASFPFISSHSSVMTGCLMLSVHINADADKKKKTLLLVLISLLQTPDGSSSWFCPYKVLVPLWIQLIWPRAASLAATQRPGVRLNTGSEPALELHRWKTGSLCVWNLFVGTTSFQ